MPRRRVADVLLDRAVLHALGLDRLAVAEGARLLAILRRVRGDLEGQLRRRLAVLVASGADPGPATTARIAMQLQSLRELLREPVATLYAELKRSAGAIVAAEVKAQVGMLEAAVPIALQWRVPSPEVLARLVELPLSPGAGGVRLGQLVAQAGEDIWADLVQEVQRGVVAGDPLDAIVRRVVGDRRDGGVLTGRKARARIEALVRTVYNDVANRGRQELFAANADVVKGWQFVAVLDTRVTAQCLAHDGKTFPLGQGPSLPLHYSCRSTAVPVLRSLEELVGAGKVDASQATPERRATMDGKAPTKADARHWLSRQPQAVQEHVLGPQRLALILGHRLKFEDLTDSAGNLIPLEQLRRRLRIRSGAAPELAAAERRRLGPGR